MKKYISISIFIILFILGQCSVFAIHNTNDKTIYIEFFSQITENSIENLISTVDEKLLEGKDRIVILMHSTGGSVSEALLIYNYLSGIEAEVITHNVGQVSSIAIILFCVGEKRYCSTYAYFQIHQTGFSLSKDIVINLKNINYYFRNLESNKNYIIDILYKRMGNKRTRKELEKDYLSEELYTSQQALEYGLVNEIKDELFPDDGERIRITN
jgi:ATP-dependent protease ClpP protease subunit